MFFFFSRSMPGSCEQGRAQKPGVTCVQNGCCEKTSFVKRIHLQNLVGLVGSLPLPFPFFFFPLWKRCGKSNISWRHLFWNHVIACTSKITSLTEMPVMGTCSWSKRDISFPTRCLPAAVQPGSYHKHNLTINPWIRDTHRHRLLKIESAC